MFAVRIVKVDYYLAPPKRGLDECYSEFRGYQLTKVPVVRIFGPTPAGQKVCVHLHGIYPYVCVPYDGTLPVDRYMYQLAVSLERALAATEVCVTGVEHVSKVELVSGTPFYGYHANEQQFLKIYFLNPQYIERAVELLQNGAVMSRSFQPYEAHIPFTLQMFIDYNLHGMNLIKFRKVTFRVDKIRTDETSLDSSITIESLGLSGLSNLSGRIWDPGNLPRCMITEDNILKTSNCELEVDAVAVDILNSSEIQGSQMNPGIAAIWEDERERKLAASCAFNLTPPISQDRPLAKSQKSELQFLLKIKQKLDSLRLNANNDLSTSQTHENSGIEVGDANPSLSDTGDIPSALQPASNSVTRLSQVSLNDDDHEVLNILMNMVDDSDDDDNPSSPEADDADEADILTMSQVVWDVNSDVEPSPNDDSDNDSGFLRSPDEGRFLQLDGANDKLDERRSLSRKPTSIKITANASVTSSPLTSIALRQCNVVLKRVNNSSPKNESMQAPIILLSSDSDSSEVNSNARLSRLPPRKRLSLRLSQKAIKKDIVPSQLNVNIHTIKPPNSPIVLSSGSDSPISSSEFVDILCSSDVKPVENDPHVLKSEDFKRNNGPGVLQTIPLDLSVDEIAKQKNKQDRLNATELCTSVPHKATSEVSVSEIKLTNDDNDRYQTAEGASRLALRKYRKKWPSPGLKRNLTVQSSKNPISVVEVTSSLQARITSTTPAAADESLPTASDDIGKFSYNGLTFKMRSVNCIKTFSQLGNEKLFVNRLDSSKCNMVNNVKTDVKSQKFVSEIDQLRKSGRHKEKLKASSNDSSKTELIPNNAITNLISEELKNSAHLKCLPLKNHDSQEKVSLNNLPEIGDSDEDTDEISDELVRKCQTNVALVRIQRLGQKTIDKYTQSTESKVSAVDTRRRRKIRNLVLFQVHKGCVPIWSCRRIKNSSKKKGKNRLYEYPSVRSAPPPPQSLDDLEFENAPCRSVPHSSVDEDNQFTTINTEFLRLSSFRKSQRRPTTVADDFYSCTWSPEIPDDHFSSSAFSDTPCTQLVDRVGGRIESFSPPANESDVMFGLGFMSPISERCEYNSPPRCFSPTDDKILSTTSRRLSEDHPDFLFYGGAYEDDDTWRRVLGFPNKVEIVDAVGNSPTNSQEFSYDVNCNNEGGTQSSVIDVLSEISQDKDEQDHIEIQDSEDDLKAELLVQDCDLLNPMNQFDNLLTLFPSSEPIHVTDVHVSQEVIISNTLSRSFSIDKISSTSPDLFSSPTSVDLSQRTSLSIRFDDQPLENVSKSSIDNTNCQVVENNPTSTMISKYVDNIIPSLGSSLESPAHLQIKSELHKSFSLELNSTADQLVDNLVLETDNHFTDDSENFILDSADVDMSLEELKSALDLGDINNANCSPEGIPSMSVCIENDCIKREQPMTPVTPLANNLIVIDAPMKSSLAPNVSTKEILQIGDLSHVDTSIKSFYTYGSSSGNSVPGNSSFNVNYHDLTAETAKVVATNIRVLTYGLAAPSPSTISATLPKHDLPEVIHPSVYCSDPKDVPDRPMEFGDGALVVRLRSNEVDRLTKFESNFADSGLEHWLSVYRIAQESGYILDNVASVTTFDKYQDQQHRCNVWEPCLQPPNPQVVKLWLCDQIAKVSDLDSTECRLGGSMIMDTSSSAAQLHEAASSVSPIMSSDEYSVNTSAIVVYHSTPGEPVSVARGRKRSLLGSLDESSVVDILEPTLTSSLPSNSPMTTLKSDDKLIATSISQDIPQKRKKKGRRLSFVSEAPPLLSLRKNLLMQNARVLSPINEKPQTSQLDGPTPKNVYGFKISVDSMQEVNSAQNHYQYVTLMSLELHVDTIGDLRPDPSKNSIRAVVYHVQHDIPEKQTEPNRVTGLIVVTNAENHVRPSELIVDNATLINVRDELSLIRQIINVVHDHNPDLLVGYEVQMSSWGFLLERGIVLGIKLCSILSRVPDDVQNNFRPVQKSGDGFNLNIVGRIVFSVGQLMRHELSLYNYTFENVAYHVLHLRIPLFSYRMLTKWFSADNGNVVLYGCLNRWRTIQHYIIRAEGNLKMLDKLNLIGRTGELARLFGIQFWEVHSRGSQFRVESMMLRLCRRAKYVAVSPSVRQRSAMRAPEHVPLIMEPISRFYTDPVVVLDFQSLYPSIIIAYNYCFSTCLGRVENLAEPTAFHFGCTSLRMPAGLISDLGDRINVSPCGVAFVNSDVRKGILPRMLEEILTTRVMVKMAMKRNKHDKALMRMLDARQLGLKLIANVTYGYTSANFSGRMPCVEIADSVVSKGRETLERAIHLIEKTTKWGAKVVYGDTDSVFVLLKGRSMEQAFVIGQEIVNAVTAENPKPIKLKLEKVYLPCVLQSKKRYVGFMYETPDQKDPVFDAKGIETVRRDGCPAVAKILEKCLRVLFTTRDVSQVRSYVVHQFQKLMSGRASLHEYIFTREYRGRMGYARPDAPAPAFRLARRALRLDPRAEPRTQERVPYVVVYGSPGSLLIDLVRHPDEVLRDSSLRLNAKYYINNIVIPPLDRVLSLVGANVRQWYATMTRSNRYPLPILETRRQETLNRFLVSSDCPICDKPSTTSTICGACSSDPQMAFIVLTERTREWERRSDHLAQICHNCVGTVDHGMDCVSTDCPILFRMVQASRNIERSSHLRGLVAEANLQW